MLPLNRQRARHVESLVPLRSARARALASGRYTGAMLELMTSARGFDGLAAAPCKSCRNDESVQSDCIVEFSLRRVKACGPAHIQRRHKACYTLCAEQKICPVLTARAHRRQDRLLADQAYGSSSAGNMQC